MDENFDSSILRLRTPSALLNASDQTQIAREMLLFFGHKPKRYMCAYSAMTSAQRTSNTKRNILSSFNIAAFFTGPLWFLYRKMYQHGILIALLLTGLFSLCSFRIAGIVSLGLLLTGALFADRIYAVEGLVHILRANKLGLDGEKRQKYIMNAAHKTVDPLWIKITSAVLVVILVILIMGVFHRATPPTGLKSILRDQAPRHPWKL